MTRRFRPTWVEIDLGALRDNVAELSRLAAPAGLFAVVKADGYGHGAVPVARAALAAGASGLAVALVEEGGELRDGGIEGPVLVLSEPAAEATDAVVEHWLTPAVYTAAGIDALAKSVAGRGAPEPLPVHLKVDTGMHRVGAAPEDALGLARRIADHPELRLEGLWTHLAVADEPDNAYTADQLAKFEAVLGELAAAGVRAELVHVANSAGLLTASRPYCNLVRAGIAVYGIPPSPALEGQAVLRPVLALKARVSHVKQLPAGARISYGLTYELDRPSRVATVPIGYADGVPRNLGAVGGEVLVRGRRHPIAGTITMDQLMVDVGDEPVEPGDEVVLIGHQDGAEVRATEWADRLGTIAYEIVCGIGPRAPRVYLDA